MYWYIVGALLVIFAGVVIYMSDHLDLKDRILNFFGAMFAVTVVLLLISMIIWLIVVSSTEESEKIIYKEKTSIISLDRSTSINGTFVIGIGTINSSRNYVVMKDLGNNRYQEKSLPQESILVEDTSMDNSYYVTNVCDYEIMTYFNIFAWREMQTHHTCYMTYEERNWAELHIPKGTVTREYNVK